jgi:hypothetical protein
MTIQNSGNTFGQTCGEKIMILINLHRNPVTVNVKEKIENHGLLTPLLSNGIAYTADGSGIHAGMLGYGYLAAAL